MSGPRALFDKSFLQQLNLGEATLFDNFFFTVITPIFYVETLADLEKVLRGGKTPEEHVGIIADKVPEMNSTPTYYHRSLAIGSLLGWDVPMNGKMLLAGKVVKSNGLVSIRYEGSAEAIAHQRWRDRDFLTVERNFAQRWRKRLAELDLDALAAGMRALGITPQNCKSLEDAKRRADELIDRTSVPHLITLARVVLSAEAGIESRALQVWEAGGRQPFRKYAPYATHVVTVELFFRTALAAELIATDRASNQNDIAYLYYLPFCNVFISADKLHRRCAPHFLRRDQQFVWGPDLKAALKELATQYLALPQEVQETGLASYAGTPPREDHDGLVGKLWDLTGTDWRRAPPVVPEQVREAIMQVIREVSELEGEEVDFTDVAPDLSNVGSVRMDHQVRLQKGPFWLGPKPSG